MGHQGRSGANARRSVRRLAVPFVVTLGVSAGVVGCGDTDSSDDVDSGGTTSSQSTTDTVPEIGNPPAPPETDVTVPDPPPLTNPPAPTGSEVDTSTTIEPSTTSEPAVETPTPEPSVIANPPPAGG